MLTTSATTLTAGLAQSMNSLCSMASKYDFNVCKSDFFSPFFFSIFLLPVIVIVGGTISVNAHMHTDMDHISRIYQPLEM